MQLEEKSLRLRVPRVRSSSARIQLHPFGVVSDVSTRGGGPVRGISLQYYSNFNHSPAGQEFINIAVGTGRPFIWNAPQSD